MLTRQVRPSSVLATFLRCITTTQESSRAVESSVRGYKGKEKEETPVNDFTDEEFALASKFIRARATDVRLTEEEDANRRRRQHAAREAEQRRLRRAQWRMTRNAQSGQQQRSFSNTAVDKRQSFALHETPQPHETHLTNLRSQLRPLLQRKPASSPSPSPGGSEANREWEALSERASQHILSEKDTMTNGVLRPGLLVEARR